MDPVGFSIGNKGYMGTGLDDYFRKDFWEYDPLLNSWTQLADFGGVARAEAVGFSIGNKGYIGTGYDADSHNLKDFWEYDPDLNNWIQKTDFLSVAYGAVGFSIGGKGYMGTGNKNSGLQKGFAEYDPVTDIWIKKADFGGTARFQAVGFSIGSKGYLGTGSVTKDFWEYDPALNTWTQKVDFGGIARSQAVGFSIGNKGYLGTGAILSGAPTSDFWEYTPEFGVGISSITIDDGIFSLFPNPNDGMITITATFGQEETLTIRIIDLTGRELFSEIIGNVTGTFSKQLDLGNYSSGTYFMQLIHDGQKEVHKMQ
ncbi:MAG: T9SS type A sorting domain-containing protein [Chitinophagaceae bacterium]|nr:T9SS type A sorting domain-containing protein [Chitinophagaceae bacterium]